MASRGHAWGQLHCGHLQTLTVVHSGDLHLGDVSLDLMKGQDNRGGVGNGFTSGTTSMKSGVQAGISLRTLGTLLSDKEDEEISASANPGRPELRVVGKSMMS